MEHYLGVIVNTLCNNICITVKPNIHSENIAGLGENKLKQGNYNQIILFLHILDN